MSHHRLTPSSGHPGYVIAVGWDRALNTYFAHVWDETENGDGTVLWIGPTTAPITDPVEAVDAVRPYVHPDVDLAALAQQLAADRGAV